MSDGTKTMGWLRAKLATMAAVPDETPVYVSVDDGDGSLAVGLTDVAFAGEHPRSPHGEWIARVSIEGAGGSDQDAWRAPERHSKEPK